MEQGHYLMHGREFVGVYESSGRGAPDYRDVNTGEIIDFFSGRPLVIPEQRQSLADSVREMDSMW